MPRLEIVVFFDPRIRNQMEVRRVHISIAEHLVFRQCSKGGYNTGLSGSSFATYDDKFFHYVSFHSNPHPDPLPS